jgi:hypothetical protein
MHAPDHGQNPLESIEAGRSVRTEDQNSSEDHNSAGANSESPSCREHCKEFLIATGVMLFFSSISIAEFYYLSAYGDQMTCNVIDNNTVHDHHGPYGNHTHGDHIYDWFLADGIMHIIFALFMAIVYYIYLNAKQDRARNGMRAYHCDRVYCCVQSMGCFALLRLVCMITMTVYLVKDCNYFVHEFPSFVFGIIICNFIVFFVECVCLVIFGVWGCK